MNRKNKCKCGQIKCYWSKQCFACSRKNKKFRRLISKINKGKHLSKITKDRISKAFHKHHLDLDTLNDNKENILRLSNGKHQRLHRLAYYYLLDKYGIKEIKKYVKWFFKKEGKIRYDKTRYR